jgi:4-amino-4-deoxy-L-arabinose transferase-like glycosyltransferase
MAAAVENVRARPRLLLAIGVLAAAFLATRLALMWRFPWFIDEMIFAGYARDVHGDLANWFVAEHDKKGLLPSWMGAGLIGAGVDPITAMRLLAAAGAALAATCGGLVVRRLYGLREGLLTAALVALGPYYLVNSSVGIYDAMVTGLVAAAILVSLHLVRNPRLPTALLLGAIVGAGGLTKPTAATAVVVLPFTLLLFDYASPRVRRRLLVWASLAMLALAIGYAITSIARLTPLYDEPMPIVNHRELSEVFDDPWGAVSATWRGYSTGLLGYLTVPGVVFALVGAFVGARRNRAGTAILAVWALSVLASALLLTLWAYPRYLAVAMVPLAGFTAIGSVAIWDAIVRASWGRTSVRTLAACAIAALALLPATHFGASVIADPVTAPYPSGDGGGYVTAISAQTTLEPIGREIERRGGPYPVHIAVAHGYPWGLELFLNGTAIGAARRFHVVADGTAEQQGSARYLVSDGLASDVPPRAGFRLIRRVARVEGGAVMRLYERDPR